MRHRELGTTSKVALLNNAPKQYRDGGMENTARVAQPAITAQFRGDHSTVTTAAEPATKAALHEANYDYKAHGFTIPGDAHPVVVARMNSYGAVSAPTGHNGSRAVPGLPPAGHDGGGFGGSSGGGGSHSGGGGHSSAGGGSSSGGGSSHSGGASGSGSSAGSSAAGAHH